MNFMGFGTMWHQLTSEIEGSGGIQVVGQQRFEKITSQLDDFIYGGGTERIVYRQTAKAWLGYKALYLLLFALRLAAALWGLTRDVPMNRAHWLGALAMATIIPGIMLLFYLFHQLTAGVVMTPNRFKTASVKLRRWAVWDTLAQLVVGVMIMATHLPSGNTTETLCGGALVLGAVCSGALYVLERRRKCVVMEPEG